MKNLTYWTYIEKEILDLVNVFSKALEVNDFDRDYEDTWEWITGSSHWLNAKINIRRKHNWKTGEYHEPLSIWIDFENESEDAIIDLLGILLSTELKAKVFFGDIKPLIGTNHDYLEKKVFE
ncbi:MAG: hypothetical protein IT258_05440 [Saprospiraceae bacterium]|nr:hypothetical protein [Saprospiraceae bacterium]